VLVSNMACNCYESALMFASLSCSCSSLTMLRFFSFLTSQQSELLMGLGSGSQASSSCSSGGDTSFGASVSSGTSSGDDSASTSLASHDTYYTWGGKLNLTGSASTESISRSTKSQEESVSSDSYCTSSDDDDDDSLASVGSGKVLNVPAAPNVSGEKKYATTPATTPDEISATASYDRYLPTYNYACM